MLQSSLTVIAPIILLCQRLVVDFIMQRHYTIVRELINRYGARFRSKELPCQRAIMLANHAAHELMHWESLIEALGRGVCYGLKPQAKVYRAFK